MNGNDESKTSKKTDERSTSTSIANGATKELSLSEIKNDSNSSKQSSWPIFKFLTFLFLCIYTIFSEYFLTSFHFSSLQKEYPDPFGHATEATLSTSSESIGNSTTATTMKNEDKHRHNSFYSEGFDGNNMSEAGINTKQANQAQFFASKPLNIVLFYADDWSFETLGAMGNTYVQTPRLDQLAKEGVLFTHNCVVTSICMQSRATLYTGQYSSRHKTYQPFTNNSMYDDGKWHNTLYPLMMKAGYHVGFFGKWHHNIWPSDIPTFSEYVSLRYHHWLERDGIMRHVTELNEEDGMNFLKKRPKHKPFFLTISFFATHAEDGSKQQYSPMNSSMHLYQDADVPIPKTFTNEHRWKLPPFFNGKNYGRSRFKERYGSSEAYQRNMKNTYRMATEVDAACGRIMDLIHEQGAMDNTLIIFTTDNGNFHGQHGLAEKWYAYEESLRVPLIIKDPRMPSSMVGTKNNEFTLNLDLAPTILSAAGVTVPSVMQGADMSALYLSPDPIATAKAWRKEFFYEFRGGDPVRLPTNTALIRRDSKYIFWEEYNYTEYFDMTSDPYEENNLAPTIEKNVLIEARNRMEELRLEAM